MHDGGVSKESALSATDLKTVALIAKEVCAYDAIDQLVLVKAGFPPSILSQLEKGRLASTEEFSREDLSRLANAIGVHPPEFLLEERMPTSVEIEAAMTAFEKGETNAQQQKHHKQ